MVLDFDSPGLQLSALQRAMLCVEAGSVGRGSAQAASDLFAQAEQLLKVGDSCASPVILIA